MAHLAQDAKTRKTGVCEYASKQMPAIGKRSSAGLTIDYDHFLINSAVTHLLWPPAMILNSPCQAAEQRNNHITLSPHSSAVCVDFCVTALIDNFTKCPLKPHFINNLTNTIQATLRCLFTYQM